MATGGIIIVDYGMGNVASLRNMFGRLGVRAELSSDPDRVRSAERVVLPGVGAFDEAMRTLRRTSLDEALTERSAAGGGPLLGVCLGMQLLLDGSDEGQGERGLGLLAGHCVRFQPQVDGRALRVPHMGWSEVETDGPVRHLPSLGAEARYYFVHSFHAQLEDTDDVLGWTTYGVRFASAIGRDEVVGLQFHPEKSHRYGLRLLADFAAAS